MDGQTDGRTDRWMGGRTDRQTDGGTDMSVVSPDEARRLSGRFLLHSETNRADALSVLVCVHWLSKQPLIDAVTMDTCKHVFRK